MLSGRYIHLRLLDRNRRQLWAREREITTTHRLIGKADRERIPLARIGEGDLLEIAPGGMVPVESILESESAKIHLDWINGEPDPVLYATGQRIPAGARNASAHSLRVVSGHAYGGSFLEQLFAPGSDDFDEHSAASSTHPIRKFYLVAVLLIAVAGGIAWLALGKGAAAALQVFISVLVVSCPCALGLALPLLDEILLAKLRRHGLFLRRHSLWSRLKRVNRLDFDKTGTLTEPIRRLTDPEAIDRLEESALAALRRLTEANHHPVARALRDVILSRRGFDPATPTAILEFPGQGVAFTEGDTTWRLGRGDWAANRVGEPCVLSRDGIMIARFHFEEAIRDGAIEQLRRLRKRGYRIRILSGDPDATRVAATAAKLGLDPGDVHANLTPAEKAAFITTDHPDKTLFVGDGGNDSLAFEAAIATGSPATGIRAIENRADFVFTGRGFHAIPLLLDAAGRRRKQVAKLFVVALCYNLGAIALCLAGLMNPLLAAILMPLSSLVTTTMAARV